MRASRQSAICNRKKAYRRASPLFAVLPLYANRSFTYILIPFSILIFSLPRSHLLHPTRLPSLRIPAVGIWFIMWQNVGKAGAKSNGNERGATSSSRNDNDPLLLHNHLVVHADCSSANRGLFAGLVVMVATAVSIIVFFLASSDERYTAMV